MPDLPDPTVAMRQLLNGYEVSQTLFALTAADVPTVLDRAGPLPVDELAERTDTHPDALRRLIRSLVPHGVFTLDDDRAGLTGLGSTLSADHAQSLRGIAIGSQRLHYLPFSELEHALRTGEPAARKYYGMPYFEWINADPARAALFHEAMGTFLETVRKDMLSGYRLPAAGVVADIGGGDGRLLSALLAEPGHEHHRGILFDLPPVVDAARPPQALAGRIDLVAGDFFAEVPAADFYLLSWILHDWDDDHARRILATIAAAAEPGARLLVVEGLVPEGDEPHSSKALDVTMLAVLGGRERTEREYRDLLGGAGFTLDRVVPTPSPFVVLEATLGRPS